MTKKPTYEELEQRVRELDRDRGNHDTGQKPYREIFAAAKDTFLIFDMDGIIREVNPAASLMYGYSRDEMIGLTGKDIVHEDFQHLFKEFVQKASEGLIFSAESVDMRKDGSTFPIEMRGSGLIYNDEPHLLAVIRDITDRKQTEAELQKERDLLRRVIQTSPAGITIVNHEGQITFANSQAEKVLGLAKEDITQRTYNQPDWHITDYDGNPLPDDKLPFSLVMATGKPVSDVRHAIERSDGQRIFLSINAAPLFTQSGEIGGMVVTIEDITERKRAEKELQDSRDMLQIILDTIPSGVFWKDRDSIYRGANLKWQNWVGLNSLEEVIGKSDYDLSWSKKEADSFRENDRRIMESGVPEFNTIEPYVRADGSQAWAKTNKVPLRDNQDRIIGILWTSEDVSELKQKEDELLQSEAKLRGILDNLPDMVVEIDPEQRVHWANKTALNLNPLAIGQTCHEAFPGNAHMCEGCLCQKAFDTGDTQMTIMYQPQLGTVGESYWENIFVPLKDRDGNTTKVIEVSRNVTEREISREREKRLQSLIVHSQKMEAIATLTGGIAHDYNNLLSIIVGNLDLARQDAEPGSDQAVFLDEAWKAATKVGHLTHELMSLSRGGAPIKELGSVNALVRAAATGLPKDAGISVNRYISPDLWPVPHDANKLEIVFRNVVRNAIEAMPEGGLLTIRAENVRVQDADVASDLPVTPGNYVRISIQDEGRGIPKEDLDKIFDPYFSTKPMGVQKGMGLGLATAHAIIQKHGGHITVNSTPGAGTDVSIYLPAARKDAPK